ncbi:hypothetical protein RsTz2092_09640 [Deferribacterales bacterium RsTz2092]|nr:hypothetical protein AGMMS49941_06330 [Deferribacterales bacterium]GHU85868.1 hypothetical protein AGMMS49941_06440 [Deferribacterales bacterium]
MYEEVVADAKRDVAVTDVELDPDAELKRLEKEAYWEYVRRALAVGDAQIARGEVVEGFEFLRNLREKYNV